MMCNRKFSACGLKALEDSQYKQHLASRFSAIHAQLQQDADEKAADAVIELLRSRGWSGHVQSAS